MITVKLVRRGLMVAAMSFVSLNASAQPVAEAQKPFEPVSGQAGKDVIWVPTPQVTVDAMLDLGKVTAKDTLVDLGSGNGVTVITAAKRGATAHGVEFNADMVELSRRLAKEAGVSAKATFSQGDLFEADLSKATVITLFLLPDINRRLRPSLLELAPGTRVVSNTFDMGDWEADEKATAQCTTSWCNALLWVVPAACLVVALLFWDRSLPLQVAAVAFGISYTLAYRRLVRFGVPRWLVVRAKSKSSVDVESEPLQAS